MKVLFDANVILDVLLDREPFFENSARLVSLVEQEIIEGYLCATTITTLDYLVARSLGRDNARSAINKILNLFKIAEVNKKVLLLSAESSFKDFEDAVQYYSGKFESVDAIVTRNIRDFERAEYPVYSPEELWGVVDAHR